jgi:hypothetical protein
LAEFCAEGGVSFQPPNLTEMVAKYQAFLAPEDPRFGAGIADWTISSEYDADPTSEADGSPIWGCMCSPSVLASDGKRRKLQPGDIAAKRAHIVVRTPTNRDDLIEIERTVMHELGHVLHAKLNLPRDAEEEIMHSLDHFFSKLSPEQGAILARSFQNPMARAYRAKEGKMPGEEEKKEPDKGGGDAPKMAEGAPRDLAAIQADMAKADPADTALLAKLAIELRGALIQKGIEAQVGGNGPASEAPPAPAPSMGMKPEDAFARKMAENTREAIEAIVDANPHLTDGQKAMARKQSTAKDARELVATYPRAANQNDAAKIGMQGNPKTNGDGEKGSPLARAVKKASANPMVRKMLGIGSIDEDGVHFEPGGGILIYTDGTTQLNHQRAVYQARQDKIRGVA